MATDLYMATAALEEYRLRFPLTPDTKIVVHPRMYRKILSGSLFQHCVPGALGLGTFCGQPLYSCSAVGDDQVVIAAPPDPQTMTEAVEGTICYWQFHGQPPSQVGCAADDMAAIGDIQDWPAALIFHTSVITDAALPAGLFWMQLADRRIVGVVRPDEVEWVNVITSATSAPEEGCDGLGDVGDDITALVDDQLRRRGEPRRTGGRCVCGEPWHGLAITEKMRQMRRAGALQFSYSYAADTSLVLCPGTPTAGICKSDTAGMPG